MNLFEEFSAPWYAQVSPGVTPGFIFSENGTVGTGKYLRVGATTTQITGQPIFGTNKLIRMRVSNGTQVATNTVIQLQARTARTTFQDIANAIITIPANNFQATAELEVILPTDVELCAYNKSGSSLSDVVLVVFLMPYA